MANELLKYYKIGSLGELLFVAIIDCDNTIQERIYSQDELNDCKIVFSEISNCELHIHNYLKGI